MMMVFQIMLEAQTTEDYIAPSGLDANNNNGLDDAYEQKRKPRFNSRRYRW